MSKQDGYASRTAADLERKYNFGQTFAEVYGLVADARKIAEEAQNAYEGLNQEQIFNLLTNYGKAQGIYRDDAGNVYVNASYIKSGKLAAEYIDAENLKVSAANITGTLTAGQIDTTNLKVSAANITGTLTIGQLPGSVAETSDIPKYTSQLTNNSGFVNATGVTSIVNGIVTADYIEALGITATNLVSRSFDDAGDESGRISIANGEISLSSGMIRDGRSTGDGNILFIEAENVLQFRSAYSYYFTFAGGWYLELSPSGLVSYNADGTRRGKFQFIYD